MRYESDFFGMLDAAMPMGAVDGIAGAVVPENEEAANQAFMDEFRREPTTTSVARPVDEGGGIFDFIKSAGETAFNTLTNPAVLGLAKDIFAGINNNNSKNATDPNALLAQQQQINSLTQSSAQLQNMIANQSQMIINQATARQAVPVQPSFFEKNKTVIIASGVGVGVLGMILLLRK